MRVTDSNRYFQPITIALETPLEVNMFKNIIVGIKPPKDDKECQEITATMIKRFSMLGCEGIMKD